MDELKRIEDAYKQTEGHELKSYKNSAEQYFAENPFVEGRPGIKAWYIHWFYVQYCKERKLKPLGLKIFFQFVKGSYSKYKDKGELYYSIVGTKYKMTKEQYDQCIYDRFSNEKGSVKWHQRKNINYGRNLRLARLKEKKRQEELKRKLLKKHKKRMIKLKTSGSIPDDFQK